jgi:hypothetical protein
MTEPADLIRAMQQQMVALQARLDQQNDTITQQNEQIRAIPQHPVTRVKPDRPSPFTGKRSENLEAWVFQMQQFCTLAPVPEDQRVTFAATFFKDQAALWWRAYYQTQDWQGNPPTWEAFLGALRGQFTPVNTSISAYDRLQ